MFGDNIVVFDSNVTFQEQKGAAHKVSSDTSTGHRYTDWSLERVRERERERRRGRERGRKKKKRERGIVIQGKLISLVQD